jgi:soluble lytic murein transglycosylase
MNKYSALSILILLFMTLSCASKIELDKSYIKKLGTEPELSPDNDSQYWSKLYLDTKKMSNGEDKCEHWEELYEKRDFPLWPIALIHNITECVNEKSEMEEIVSDYPIEDLPKWAHKNYLEAIHSKKSLVPVSELTPLLYKLMDFKNRKDQKTKLLQEILAQSDEQQYREALIKIAPRFIENPTHEQRYSIARDLERQRKFSESRTIYREIIANAELHSYEDRVNSYDRIWKSHKTQRDRLTSIQMLEDMVEWLKAMIKRGEGPDNKVHADYFERRVLLARAMWTEGNLKGGRRVLQKSLKMKKLQTNKRAQILWILGKMAEEQKGFFRAIKLFKQASKLSVTNKKLVENIYWSLTWNLIQNNQLSSAIANLKVFSKDPNVQMEKYLFWLGHCYRLMKKNDLAHETWQQVIAEHPRTYYSIISHIQLGLPFTPINAQQLNENFIEPTLEWLISHNELHYAKEHFQGLIKTMKESDDFLHYFPKTKWHSKGIRFYYKIDETLRNEKYEKYLQLRFPLAYYDRLKSHADRNNVDPAIMLAISRQESLFNPDARSWTDAYGLMQIIPEQAKKLALESSLTYKGPIDLFNPELNFALGSLLISKLKNRYNNKLPLFAASYNASSKAVENWYNTRFKGNFFEFIEEIPYRETKKYVKHVLQNYVIYKRFLASEPFKISKANLHDMI